MNNSGQSFFIIFQVAEVFLSSKISTNRETGMFNRRASRRALFLALDDSVSVVRFLSWRASCMVQ
jgi:hypothetical protein